MPYIEYEYHDGVYEIRYRAVKKKKIAYASYGGIQGLIRFPVFHVNFRINEEAFFSETLILPRRDYWGSVRKRSRGKGFAENSDVRRYSLTREQEWHRVRLIPNRILRNKSTQGSGEKKGKRARVLSDMPVKLVLGVSAFTTNVRKNEINARVNEIVKGDAIIISNYEKDRRGKDGWCSKWFANTKLT